MLAVLTIVIGVGFVAAVGLLLWVGSRSVPISLPPEPKAPPPVQRRRDDLTVAVRGSSVQFNACAGTHTFTVFECDHSYARELAQEILAVVAILEKRLEPESPSGDSGEGAE